MPPDSCPFCHPSSDRILTANPLTLVLWDGYPVSPGHTLIITKRHVPTWFDPVPS